MATNPAPFSDEFARTAREEADRLSVRATELRARGERWLARAHAVLAEAESLESQVRDLDELLGRAPQLRIDLQTGELQGQQLRDAAARILMQRRGPGVPIHYREWYELFIESGLAAGGKDPLATFLTQITRSPIVSRVEGGEGGIYLLDPSGAYDRAREAVAEGTRRVRVLRETGEKGSDQDNMLAEAERHVVRARQQLDAVIEARLNLLHARLAATRAAAHV